MQNVKKQFKQYKNEHSGQENIEEEFKRKVDVAELKQLDFQKLGFSQQVDKEFIEILIGMQK